MAVERPTDPAGTARGEEEARWSEWMVRANTGDADAYARLLEEVGRVMERYLRRRFGGSEFIEDCVQECLLAIHRARASYDPQRRFRPWLFTIVRHKAIDLLRRRGTRQRHEAGADRGEEATAPMGNPTAALEAAEALEGLTQEYRDALILTKLEGHSLDEAARYAGVSVTAMKTRVHRAIQQVRRRLAEEED